MIGSTIFLLIAIGIILAVKWGSVFGVAYLVERLTRRPREKAQYADKTFNVSDDVGSARDDA